MSMKKYYADSQLPSPSTIHASLVDTASRKIIFTWSPVAPECPAISYNINTSNCGSCPTTTNHTTVSCIDVPVAGDNTTACAFALQAINCETIIGKMSDPITVLLRETSNNSVLSTQSAFNNTKINQNHINTATLALACVLAIGLVVSTAALVTMTAFMYQSRSSLRVAKWQTSHELATTIATEIPEYDYEIIIQSSEDINTNTNVAYDPVTVVK